jgi:multidrug efflux pump subunit AcrA (membrane-fusion protein)
LLDRRGDINDAPLLPVIDESTQRKLSELQAIRSAQIAAAKRTEELEQQRQARLYEERQRIATEQRQKDEEAYLIQQLRLREEKEMFELDLKRQAVTTTLLHVTLRLTCYALMMVILIGIACSSGDCRKEASRSKCRIRSSNIRIH